MPRDVAESRMAALCSTQPLLLWMVSPSTPTPTPSRQHRRRVELLLQSMATQFNQNNHVLLEANVRNNRVWVFDPLEQWLFFCRDSGRLRTHILRTCSLLDGKNNAIQGAIRLETTLPFTSEDGQCTCGVPEKKHTSQLRRGDLSAETQRQYLTAIGLARLIATKVASLTRTTGHRARPESLPTTLRNYTAEHVKSQDDLAQPPHRVDGSLWQLRHIKHRDFIPPVTGDSPSRQLCYSRQYEHNLKNHHI